MVASEARAMARGEVLLLWVTQYQQHYGEARLRIIELPEWVGVGLEEAVDGLSRSVEAWLVAAAQCIVVQHIRVRGICVRDRQRQHPHDTLTSGHA